VLGVVLSLLQDFALSLVEFHKVPIGPFLQPVKVALEGRMTLWHVSHSSQFSAISKLVDGKHWPIIQIISEDVK